MKYFKDNPVLLFLFVGTILFILYGALGSFILELQGASFMQGGLLTFAVSILVTGVIYRYILR